MQSVSLSVQLATVTDCFPIRHFLDTVRVIRYSIYYYYYYYFKPTSTKPQAEILTLNKVNGCNDVSFGDHSVLEGDRIPPLKSHGQALEEELCFPGVLSDN